MRAQELTDGGNVANQARLRVPVPGDGDMDVLPGCRSAQALVRPALVAMLVWFALCVVTSWEPALSARRLAFTLIAMGLAGMTLLLPKNLRHFTDLLTVATLVVLALCYGGVLLVPDLAVHQASDFLEPEHAGS
jgi:hypothetical protein